MSSANLEMNGIPYKGEALALNDLLSGRLHLMFISGRSSRTSGTASSAPWPHADSRSPLLPEVPTMVEAGLPPFPSIPG